MAGRPRGIRRRCGAPERGTKEGEADGGYLGGAEQACGQCRNCALAETRLHVVFGDGARDAEILLVGEGPGQREDEQGIPFVGPAGLLLDDMLEIIGLDRTKVYVANIVKCRPPRNRDR